MTANLNKLNIGDLIKCKNDVDLDSFLADLTQAGYATIVDHAEHIIEIVGREVNADDPRRNQT